MRHGGISGMKLPPSLSPNSITDFSASLNPLGPPPEALGAYLSAWSEAQRYPDPEYREFRSAAAALYGVDPCSVIPGNGTDELMHAVLRALKPPECLVPVPSYSGYEEASTRTLSRVIRFPLDEDKGFAYDLAGLGTAIAALSSGSAVWIGNPNNPTASVLPESALSDLFAAFPSVYFLVDDAFADFLPDRGRPSPGDNVIRFRSLTKFFSVPGLRAGFGIVPSGLAAAVRGELPEWPVNSAAAKVGPVLCGILSGNDPSGYGEKTRQAVAEGRGVLVEGLRALGFSVGDSSANFVLAKVPPRALPVPGFVERLLAEGFAIRDCASFPGLGGGFVRIAVRRAEENRALLDSIESAIASDGLRPAAAKRRRAKALMIQGTSSGAGKSLLCAALCRILRQDGYDVAPFKAQNMSLNSGPAIPRGEIGRAQIVQAAACGLEPDVRMNPILLKPCADTMSQVVVMGIPDRTISAMEYYARFEALRGRAFDAYDSLQAEHEVMVLEGAGSPGEINLKARDFVNMRAAEHARARVYIAGDIDRGGVLASFIGHAAVMEPWERALVAGFIVNKFRGDPELLGDAYGLVEKMSGLPVVGTVPMIRGLSLPEEDETVIKNNPASTGELKIGVVALAHPSNFTDFEAFSCEPDALLSEISGPRDLKGMDFDALVIPGSKTTISDLAVLERNGMAAAIAEFARTGKAVLGICGGYQMLGLGLDDAEGLDGGRPGIARGLGLLPLDTEFFGTKTVSMTRARHVPTGMAVRGYEIHCGRTIPRGSGQAAEREWVSETGEVIGYRAGNVTGTYLHGLFDDDSYRRHWLDALRQGKGLSAVGKVSRRDTEAVFDCLADHVRKSVDIKRMYRDMGLQ